MAARFRWHIAILLAALWAVTPASAQELLVFAAASLKDALDTALATHRTGAGARAAFGSSSTLARQIEHGAPADVFLSANPDWMDYLDERGLIRPESRIDLVGNALVLIAPAREPVEIGIAVGFDLAGALGDERLAMGDPDHVPAGMYGRAALQSLGVWEAVRARVARADNVRAALALVARAEAPLGIVYRSDAAAEPAVRVVDTFPPDSHPPIVYPIAAVAASERPEAAAALVDFLSSPSAAPVFERFGFTVLD